MTMSPGCIEHISANRSLDTELKLDEEVFAPFFENDFDSKKKIEEAVEFYRTATGDKAYSAPTIVVDSEMIRKYNETARQKVDIEKFERGEVCLVESVLTKKQADFVRGKKITLIDSDTRREKELEVGACLVWDEDRGINVGYYWEKGGALSGILISEKAAEEFCDDAAIDSIIADCEKDAEPYVRREIEGMVKGNPYVMRTEIKSKQMADFNSSMSAMNILSGGISAVLILIGIINFINVMLTGVYTRRMELAVLESVGMAKKQVHRMLCFEGAYYGLISILLILTVGNVMIYMVGNFARQVADYAVFYYPAVPLLGIAAAIMGICFAVPSIVYRILSKESVTERLRSGE